MQAGQSKSPHQHQQSAEAPISLVEGSLKHSLFELVLKTNEDQGMLGVAELFTPHSGVIN